MIGVDPGLNGAVCIFDLSTNEIIFHCMPIKAKPRETDGRALAAIFRSYPQALVVVEEAQHMPKYDENGEYQQTNAQAMCNYGRGHGIILGVIEALGLPGIRVRPNKWTKYMHFDVPDGHPKQKSLMVVQRMWPHLNLFPSTRYKKPHDGWVDALLIAYYGVKHILHR